jgi:hypothetical protein
VAYTCSTLPCALNDGAAAAVPVTSAKAAATAAARTPTLFVMSRYITASGGAY